MTDGKMMYEDILPLTREEIEKIIDKGDPIEIPRMLIAVAFHENDLTYAFYIIEKYFNNPDENFRAISLTALGHLARIHKQLPVKKTMNLLKIALGDTILVRGMAENAYDDIMTFIPDMKIELEKLVTSEI